MAFASAYKYPKSGLDTTAESPLLQDHALGKLPNMDRCSELGSQAYFYALGMSYLLRRSGRLLATTINRRKLCAEGLGQ